MNYWNYINKVANPSLEDITKGILGFPVIIKSDPNPGFDTIDYWFTARCPKCKRKMGTLARFTYESLLHNRVDIVQDIMSEVADAIKRTMEEHDCK